MRSITLYSVQDSIKRDTLIHNTFYLDSYKTHEQYLKAVTCWLDAISAVYDEEDDKLLRNAAPLSWSSIPDRFIVTNEGVNETYFKWQTTLIHLEEIHGDQAQTILEGCLQSGFSFQDIVSLKGLKQSYLGPSLNVFIPYDLLQDGTFYKHHGHYFACK
ncbi:hypothetical protein [Zooshikella sp. RANM57]|uniref:hypothetical protein n=1 Tax=Zooshikella sp. RANM57 TaxID=3425863 RepID=UPI003D6DEFB4